jgi:hypothetical protein
MTDDLMKDPYEEGFKAGRAETMAKILDWVGEMNKDVMEGLE